MPIEPIFKRGFLPILSITKIAIRQANILTIPLDTFISNESDSEKPADCHYTDP